MIGPQDFAAAGLSDATVQSCGLKNFLTLHLFISLCNTRAKTPRICERYYSRITHLHSSKHHRTPIIRSWTGKPSRIQPSQPPAGRRRLRKTQRKTSGSSHGRRCWAKHMIKGLRGRIGSTCNCRIMFNAGVWLRDGGQCGGSDSMGCKLDKGEAERLSALGILRKSWWICLLVACPIELMIHANVIGCCRWYDGFALQSTIPGKCKYQCSHFDALSRDCIYGHDSMGE